MERCLIYLSHSVGLLSEKELTHILQQSRQNNARVNITGVLLYLNGHIIQVLEGEKQVLLDLYKRIEADPRHTDVTCVLNRSIQVRQFARWSMGYQTLTSSQFEEIQSIVELEKKAAGSDDKESAIIKTLKAFYDINRQD